MKYLYPYECEKLKLSNPGELQAAIDGNRREGRRPGYGYDFSPLPTMIPPSPHHLGAGLLNGRPSLPNPGESTVHHFFNSHFHFRFEIYVIVTITQPFGEISI